MIDVEKVDHICVAVHDLKAAMEPWGLLFGKSKPDMYYRHEPEAIEWARYYVGEVGFDLMASIKEGSDVDRFLKNRGEGIMLISFKVPNTVAAIDALMRHGFQMIDTEPRVWLNSLYAFMNPRFMNGVLIEIIDESLTEKEHAASAGESADESDKS